MHDKFQSALAVRVDDYGAWPLDVLERHPQIAGYLSDQGLTPEQIDQVLVSVITGNWDLTSAYMCCTGSAPLAEDRPDFLAEFLGQNFPLWLSREAYLEFGKLLMGWELI